MFHLVWSNISRRKNQSLLTIAITALTVFTFVLIFGVFITTRHGLSASVDRLGADVIIVPPDADIDGYDLLFTANPESIYMDAGIIDEVKKLDGVAAASPQFFSQTVNGGCCDFGTSMRLVGFDPGSDFIVKALMNQKDYDKLSENDIILGGNFTDYVGKESRVLDKVFHVAGELYPTGTGIDDTVFMRIDRARTITEESENLDVIPKGADSSKLISAIMIKLEEGVEPAVFANDFLFTDINAECIATSATVAAVQEQLNDTSSVLFLLWIALLAVAVLSLVGRFNALAKDRKKETGLMRAMGVRKKSVFALIIGEAFTMALIGGALGSGLACCCINPVMGHIQQTFRLPPSVWSPGMTAMAAILGIVLAVLICIAAAMKPAAASASLEPQAAITQGEVN